MAKYEDYASRDTIDDEIEQAAQQTEDRKDVDNPGFEMPDRFKDKTPEEIAKSYDELEKAYSRQGNDLGRMRNTMDEYIANLESTTQQTSPEEVAPVTIDDLYDDTEGAIERAAGKVYGDKIAQLEAELEQTKLQTRVDALSDKFGDWETEVQTPEFVNWAADSPYRLRLVQQADRFDMDAAEEILGLWSERKGMNNQQQAAVTESQLRDASLESGSAEVTHVDKPMSRTEIIDHRIKANHGDSQSQAWLKQNQDAISAAYQEGNLTD